MTAHTTTAAPAQFVRRVRLPAEVGTGRYPFTLPAVGWLADNTEGLELPGGVTFLVGDNGIGKSTLIEALAVAAGFNPEGGSQNFR
ncbi:MAG: AAA family ATPase, partial [Thermocrispum sp.]